MPPLQQYYFDLLLDRVRGDRYPSHQLLDRIESELVAVEGARPLKVGSGELGDGVGVAEWSRHARLLLRMCSHVVSGHRLLSSAGSARPQLHTALARAALVM